MKRFSVLVCLLFGAALVFAAAPGGQPETPEPSRHIVLFQHMLQAYLQNCFGGGEGEELLLNTGGQGQPQNQARAQTCDPDCDPPCEPDRLRIQARDGTCDLEPVYELDAEQDRQQEQKHDQDHDHEQQQKRDQSCK